MLLGNVSFVRKLQTFSDYQLKTSVIIELYIKRRETNRDRESLLHFLFLLRIRLIKTNGDIFYIERKLKHLYACNWRKNNAHVAINADWATVESHACLNLRARSVRLFTFTIVHWVIRPSEDTEKKFMLLSRSSFCHFTCNKRVTEDLKSKLENETPLNFYK